MINLVLSGGLKWYQNKAINKKRTKTTTTKRIYPMEQAALEKKLICLVYCFHLAHMMHLYLMLFE